MQEQDKIRLWARLGVSLDVTKEEAEILSGSNYLQAQNLLKELIRTDRCYLDGDTYFPERDPDDDAKGIPEIPFDFDLTGPLHPEPEKDFTIDTPHGTLHIFANQDQEYPGVWVDLKQPDGYDITLTLVEYIPGGEGLCDYDPSRPNTMQRQMNEVPEGRREGDSITAGFVSRSWPNEREHEDEHYRTFHTGYPYPREQTLEGKLQQASDRITPSNQKAAEKEAER